MAATQPPQGPVKPEDRKGARIVGSARSDLSEALCRRYRAGESIRSMAADVGRSYGFVLGLLKEQGVTLRPRGGDTRGPAAVARRAEVLEEVEQVRAELAHSEPAKKSKKSEKSQKSNKGKKN